MSEEEWRDVPGKWPYEVSDRGRVRHTLSGRVKEPQTDHRGYQRVKLMLNGDYKHCSIHSLVLRAFRGPPPTEEHETNHLSGNKADNRLANLEWVTRRENTLHAYENGLMEVPRNRSGEEHPNAKITEKDVRDIREAYENEDVIYEELAERYPISAAQVGSIIRREKWAHVK